MPKKPQPSKQRLTLAVDETLLHPGMRLAVAVSGGADSMALLRSLLERREPLGLVLSVVHIHHGIRGQDANGDQAFVEELARMHDLPIVLRKVDTPARIAAHRETLEEAARCLRYEAFDALLRAGSVDAIATAHTLDDQAETVLHKLLRGAWTEGLGGISPVLKHPAGRILRPLLGVARAEVEEYLHALGQPWREDASNRHLVHTRNRLRHHLLPILKEYNPQVAQQLSRVATIARDEEAWWQREVMRIGAALLLPGKPVRGGGRSSSTRPEDRAVAFELERLRALDPALRRRVLRWAAGEVGFSPDFEQTERLMQLCAPGSQVPRRVDFTPEVSAQRTARELQLLRSDLSETAQPPLEMELPVPGTMQVEAAGLVFQTVRVDGWNDAGDPVPPVVIRRVHPADRVTLRHTSAPKKVKEIFERLRLPAGERAARLVAAWEGSILWLEGVDLDPASLPRLVFRLEVRKV